MKQHFSKNKEGFALISTLSIIVLLAFIAVGLLSLSSLSLRASSNEIATEKAKTNAELGLLEALSELQVTMGPDQRISANAGIMKANPGDENASFKDDIADVLQPNLVGVWHGMRPANSDPTSVDYKSLKTTEDPDQQLGVGFIRWLSSGNNGALDFPETLPANDPVVLVGEGTITDNNFHVSANSVPISNNGAYAWHVFDESQKLNILRDKDSLPTTAEEKIAALNGGDSLDFSYSTNFSTLENTPSEELMTMPNLYHLALGQNLSGYKIQDNEAFLHLTTYSKGLLTDSANGGLQKDLSLLFENDTLPAPYDSNRIYQDDDSTQVSNSPTRHAGAEPMPNPDPSWALLHDHYKLYRTHLQEDGSVFYVDATDDEEFSSGNSDLFDKQRLLPVVSNAQFIFSLLTTEGGNPPSQVGFLNLAVSTVITLWNPYNVELRFSEMEMEFHRFPLDVKFLINGVARAKGDGFVNLANMFNAGNMGGWGNQDTVPYRARIHPNNTGGEIILQPGEYKVFSPTSFQRHHQLWHYRKGVILKEGWITDGNGGSINTRFLMADDTGTWAGNTGGAWIVLNQGDVVNLEVRARKVDRTDTGTAETNNEEIAAYIKVFQGDGGDDMNSNPGTRTQVGAIELDLDNLSVNLPSIIADDLLTYEVDKATIAAHGYPVPGKQPFLNASIRLKTEIDSSTLGSSPTAPVWLQNGLTNPYSTMGISGDQTDVHEKAHQYEMTWTPMSSWADIPGVEINPQNQGFGGIGVTSSYGLNQVPYLQIPLVPATSLSHLSHAPINMGGQAPLTTQVIGNSFAPLTIAKSNKSSVGSIGTNVDHSYMANSTLFDGYFLSTLASQQGEFYSQARPLDEVVNSFFDSSEKLPNPLFEPVKDVIEQGGTIDENSYEEVAQYIYNKGAFNVNSTSVDAWTLFLSSGTHESLPILDALTGSINLNDSTSTGGVAFSRFTPMLGDDELNDLTAIEADNEERWASHRRLNAQQVRELASAVVDEVKKRGPFQSVSEFINRQLVNDSNGDKGVLQAAIDTSTTVNKDFGLAAPSNMSELSGGGTANSSDGAPSQLIQSDILNRLAPSLTVRGDTFLIRSYGTSTNKGQKAEAWCEAVVQRTYDYVDNSQPPSASDSTAPNLNAVNTTLGRKFKVISLKWLSKDEV